VVAFNVRELFLIQVKMTVANSIRPNIRAARSPRRFMEGATLAAKEAVARSQRVRRLPSSALKAIVKRGTRWSRRVRPGTSSEQDCA
jgi:hypothetical protein